MDKKVQQCLFSSSFSIYKRVLFTTDTYTFYTNIFEQVLIHILLYDANEHKPMNPSLWGLFKINYETIDLVGING